MGENGEDIVGVSKDVANAINQLNTDIEALVIEQRYLDQQLRSSHGSLKHDRSASTIRSGFINLVKSIANTRSKARDIDAFISKIVQEYAEDDAQIIVEYFLRSECVMLPPHEPQVNKMARKMKELRKSEICSRW